MLTRLVNGRNTMLKILLNKAFFETISRLQNVVHSRKCEVFLKAAKVLVFLFFSAPWGLWAQEIDQELPVMPREFKSRFFSQKTPWGRLRVAIHYRESKRFYVERVIDVLKKEVMALNSYFSYVPQRRVDIVLHDSNDFNGFASGFPQNVIALYDRPPEGKHFLVNNRNWVRGLLIHEWTHMLMLDRTEGFLKFLRWIFGSTAKLSGIVPNWFSEGLAVWAETHFTQDGRSRHPSIEAEIRGRLRRKDFCRKLSCLDEPGTYPYGASAYWIGGRFMSYLEGLHPGTMACFLKRNAYGQVFNRGKAFKVCLHRKAHKLYQDFLTHLLGDHQHKYTFPRQHFLHHGAWHLQKGVVPGKQHEVFVVGEDRGDFFLLKYHLKTGAWQRYRPKRKIKQIVGPSATADQKGVWLQLASRNPQSTQTFWQYLDGETLTVKKELTFANASYVLGPYQLSYENSRWKIKDQQEEVLATLAPLTQIKDPLWSPQEGKLYFIVQNEEQKKSALVSFHVKTRRWQSLLKSRYQLSYAGSCSGRPQWLMHRNHQKYILRLQTEGAGYRAQLDKNAVLPLMAQVHFYKNQGFYQSLKTGALQSIDCQRFARHSQVVKSWALSPRPYHPREFEIRPAPQEKIYRPARHLYPHYWVLWYSYVNGLSTLSAKTSMNDPLKKTLINLGVNYLLNAQEVAPYFSLTRRIKGMSLSGEYYRDYFLLSSSARVNRTDYLGFSLRRSWRLENVEMTPHLSASWEDTRDIFSERTILEGALGYRFRVFSGSYRPYFKSFSASLTSFYRQGSNVTDYLGVKASTQLRLRLGAGHALRFHARYSRFFKDDFTSGLIYGGAVPNDLERSQIFHEVYGLEYGDLVGNQVFTQRLQFFHDLWQIRQGLGLSPFYFKKLSFFWGLDAGISERVLYQRRVFRDQFFASAHVGLSLDMTVMFRLPLTLQFVAARPFGLEREENTYTFIMKVPLSF